MIPALARVPVPARILLLLLLALAAAVVASFAALHGSPGPHLAMVYDVHSKMVYD